MSTTLWLALPIILIGGSQAIIVFKVIIPMLNRLGKLEKR